MIKFEHILKVLADDKDMQKMFKDMEKLEKEMTSLHKSMQALINKQKLS
ncbi:hypothetical protein SAMN02799630_03818 [Paenibacillus sp. UNCCL117]|nr:MULTISPECIES: hypothetical protein [unclassified Paenibacillus]SDD58992.1 hypothetical protein SAMN04488602_110119 [Paenibacillus sp. cl123]SFW50905.1 hypothetical protein SAMN02799630_03818 [Paenibacillus sp. UNCCL117]